MSIRNVIVLVGILLLAVLAAANWRQLSAPVELDLIIRQYEAPFGLAVLGLLAVFGLLVLVAASGIEKRGLRKKLDSSKQLEAAQKARAESEAGRILELESLVRTKLDALEAKIDRLAERSEKYPVG